MRMQLDNANDSWAKCRVKRLKKDKNTDYLNSAENKGKNITYTHGVNA